MSFEKRGDYTVTDWSVRPATPGDAGAITSVFDQVYDNYGYTDEVIDSLENGENSVLVLERNGEVVGTSSLVEHGGGWYELGRTAIKEEGRSGDGERSPFRDLRWERENLALENDPSVLFTSAVTRHAKTQHMYGDEYEPIAVEPESSVDKHGTGSRDTTVKMARLEEDANSGDQVFLDESYDELFRHVENSLGLERETAAASGFDGVSTGWTDTNGLTKVEVGEGGQSLQEAFSEIEAELGGEDPVQVYADANSPVAPAFSGIDQLHPTGFLPNYQGGSDRLLLSYFPSDSPEEGLQVTEEVLNFMEKTGVYDTGEFRQNPEFQHVYDAPRKARAV